MSTKSKTWLFFGGLGLVFLIGLSPLIIDWLVTMETLLAYRTSGAIEKDWSVLDFKTAHGRKGEITFCRYHFNTEPKDNPRLLKGPLPEGVTGLLESVSHHHGVPQEDLPDLKSDALFYIFVGENHEHPAEVDIFDFRQKLGWMFVNTD